MQTKISLSLSKILIGYTPNDTPTFFTHTYIYKTLTPALNITQHFLIAPAVSQLTAGKMYLFSTVSRPLKTPHCKHSLRNFPFLTVINFLKPNRQLSNSTIFIDVIKTNLKSKGKGHPCTGTEALYRPYGP